MAVENICNGCPHIDATQVSLTTSEATVNSCINAMMIEAAKIDVINAFHEAPPPLLPNQTQQLLGHADPYNIQSHHQLNNYSVRSLVVMSYGLLDENCNAVF